MKNTPATTQYSAQAKPYSANLRHRVWHELRELGMSWVALHTEEGYYLPRIIHDNEHIGGVAYGWNKSNFCMLVATDRRVIFLDKKPLFTKEDEVAYHVVSGVDFSSVGIGATVTLHTRVRDFVVFTLNETTAEGFVRYIESYAVEQEPYDVNHSQL